MNGFIDFDTLDMLSRVCMDGIIVIDTNETVVYVNDVYCEGAGIKKDDCIGRPILSILKSSRLPESLRSKKPSEGFLHDLSADLNTAAENRVVYINRMPILDKCGNIVGALGCVKFRSISEKVSRTIQDMMNELSFYKDKLSQDKSFYSFDNIATENEKMKRIKTTAMRVAKSELPVLIMGETGTGKEVFANAIHFESDRKYGPFVKVNCASLPEALVESELFGYEEGAFSGAKKGGKAGKFELSNGGTIFLDEIGELPLGTQSKLLRVLQENESERLGGTKTIKLDFRLIAATNQNLAKMVSEKKFREDLYYRLNVVPIRLPPLRERREDIPNLIRLFLDDFHKSYGTNIDISEKTIDLIAAQPLPGNVRELKNIIGRAYIMCERNCIDEDALNFLNEPKANNKNNIQSISNQKKLQINERDTILSTLTETNFNIKKTAGILGVHRNTIYNKMRKYQIEFKR